MDRSQAVTNQERAVPLRMGIFSVLVFSVASIGLASSGLTPFSTLAGIFPGSNLPLLITVGMAICLLLGYIYAVIGSAVRRNGADYILASRVLNPAVAFAFSWTMVLFSALIAGVIVAKAGQVAIPVFMRSIATIANVPGMLLSANYIASPEGISIIGSIGVGLAFVFSILPARINLRILQIGFFLTVVSWGTILVMLFLPSGSFQVSWDRFMGEGAFATQLMVAGGAGMPLDLSSQTLVLAGLLAAMWIYYGFQAPVYLAGEIKPGGRALFFGSSGAVVLAWLVIGGAALLLQRLVPSEWISSQSYLALNGQDSLPWLNFYAAIARPDPFLVSIFSLAWVVSLLNLAQAFFTFTSRIVLAWTDDGLLPAPVGYIHPQLKTPIIAILAVAILSQFGVWLVAAGSGNITAEFYFLFFAMYIQIPPILAVALAPYTRKVWFAGAGRLANIHVGPLPLISLAGLLGLAYLIGVVVLGWMNPFLVRSAIESLLLLVGLVSLGIVYFIFRRRKVHGKSDPFLSFPPPCD